MTFKRNRRYATFVQDLSEFNECCEERDAEISAAEKDAMDLMDLIERLRDVSELEDIDHDICDTAREAAKEIEELREALISTSLPLYDEVEKEVSDE